MKIFLVPLGIGLLAGAFSDPQIGIASALAAWIILLEIRDESPYPVP